MDSRDGGEDRDEPKAPKALEIGAVKKAIVREGTGKKVPKEGQLVSIHFAIKIEEEDEDDEGDDDEAGGGGGGGRRARIRLLYSTRKEDGGSGVPKSVVLGKNKMVRGLEYGLPSMQKGEIAVFKIMSKYAYGDPDCVITAPPGIPGDRDLMFEVELLDWTDVKVICDDGELTKQVLKEGDGWETPRPPYEVEMSIVGFVVGKKPFLEKTEEEPLRFTMGRDEVSEAIERAVRTMLLKEEALVRCTSKKYLRSNEPILDEEEEVEVDFRIQLLKMIQVRDVFGDGEVIKRRVKDGRGEFPVDCPLEDCSVRIHCRGWISANSPTATNSINSNNNITTNKKINTSTLGTRHGGGKGGGCGEVFWDTRLEGGGREGPFEFGTGEGLLPPALETSIRLMTRGEIAIVSSTGKHAYDKIEPRPNGVLEGCAVEWEVELVDFDKPKDLGEMTFGAAMMEVNDLRERGNRVFKAGRYDLAKDKYVKLLRQVEANVACSNEEESGELARAKVMIQLNTAACFQKLKDYVNAINYCNKVLEEDPSNVKAYYRRGQAYTYAGDFDEARADFKKMRNLDPSSEQDASAGLALLKRKEQEYKAKSRSEFGGFFDKAAMYDPDIGPPSEPKPVDEVIGQSSSSSSTATGAHSKQQQATSRGLRHRGMGAGGGGGGLATEDELENDRQDSIYEEGQTQTQRERERQTQTKTQGRGGGGGLFGSMRSVVKWATGI